MDLTILTQVGINGILLGVLYGTAALGLSLIFGTMRILFISQGAVIVLGGYASYYLFTLLGINPYFSIIPVVILGFLLGIAFYYGLFKEAALLQDKTSSLLIALGVSYILENLMTILFLPNPRSIVLDYGAISFWGLNFTIEKLIGLAILIVATIAVYLFLSKTIMGIALRATSEDVGASAIMGINVNMVNVLTFSIGIALAGIAGINLATTYSFDPNTGFALSIKALIALTLGGMGSVSGAILGGVILGLIESYSSFLIGPGWSPAVYYGIFFIALTLKPEGILGKSVKKA